MQEMIAKLTAKDDKYDCAIADKIISESQEFVLELDKYLTEKGSKRTIKTAKSGFVTSYSSPKSGKALLNEERNFAAVRKLVESEIDYADRG